MVNKCEVPGCQPDGKKRYSLFGVPKQPKERGIWEQILKCELPEKRFVCEKHFEEKWISNKFTATTISGQVIYQRNFKRAVLRKGAVPTYSCLTDGKQSPANICGQIPPQNFELSKDKAQNVIMVDCEHETSELTVNEDVVMTDSPPSSGLQILNVEIIRLVPTSIHTSVEVEDSYLRLRQQILDRELDVQVPNERWSMSRHSESGTIIFIFSTIIVEENGDGGRVPRSLKLISFGPTIDLVVLDKKINPNTFGAPTSVLELEGILNQVNSMRICPGGPNTKYYVSATPGHAFKDHDVWRHNKCLLILQHEKICKFCSNLHTTLTQCIERQKIPKKRTRLPQTSSKQTKLVSIRRKNKIVSQRLLRRNRCKRGLEAKLADARRKISEVQKRKLNDFLAQYKVPRQLSRGLKKNAKLSKK